ncbi:MAG: glycosyltransferase [Calothrix sp. MO_167.B42]|nr:glycosyltransferase [Calothrix sp. MO_167.B42]
MTNKTGFKKEYAINVITGQGGAGHYATYYAIKAVVEQQKLPWQFQVTDMDDIITKLSQRKKVKNAYDLLGFSAHDLYNSMVQSGWTWLWLLMMRLNKLLVKLNYKMGVSLFEQHWREQQPDLIISVMPLFNKAIWESIQRAKPGTPVVTILTDFADCPPAFWSEPETGNYLVCGTEKALEQARLLGVKADRIVKTSGLVIHPNFYQPVFWDRGSQRQKLGLNPDCPTGLVMFGGNGSKVMLDIAKRLECFQDQLQLIFLCGRDQELASALRQSQGRQKRFVTTFTEDIPYYMSLADFFIGKPGNVSISEAMAMKLPIITEGNALTMIQEKYCCESIKEKDVGIVISNFRDIKQAVTKLIQPENYARYRANLNNLNNQALFEVVDFLQTILEQRSQVTATRSKPVGTGYKSHSLLTQTENIY